MDMIQAGSTEQAPSLPHTRHVHERHPRQRYRADGHRKPAGRTMHRRLTDKTLSRAHLRIQLSHSDCEGSQRIAKLKTQNAPMYHELLPVGYRDVYYIAMASGMPIYRHSGSAAWCVLRSSAKAMFCSMVGRRASWGIELVSTRADGRLDTSIP